MLVINFKKRRAKKFKKWEKKEREKMEKFGFGYLSVSRDFGIVGVSILSFVAKFKETTNVWLKKGFLYSQSTLIERVFLIAPFTDMRRRKLRGLNDVPRIPANVFFCDIDLNKCSSKYA